MSISMSTKHFCLVGTLVLLATEPVGCKKALHTGSKGSGGRTSLPDGGNGGTAGASADGGSAGTGGLPVGGTGGDAGFALGGAGGTGVFAGAGGAAGGAGGGGMAGSTARHDGGSPNTGGQAGTATSIGGSGGRAAGGAGGFQAGGAGGTQAGGGGGGGGAPPVLGGAKTAGTSGTAPVGDRPVDWTPPFVGPVGKPGWEDGTSPICDNGVGLDQGLDAWADERGVFALISAACSDGNRPCNVFDASVQLNTGSGWRLFHQFPADATSYPAMLGGFPRGPLVMTGTFDKQYGMAFLDEKGLVFQGSMVGPAFATSTATGGDLAYAFDAKQMLKYAAGTWSPAGEAGPNMLSVWTDGQTVVAVGADQTVLMGSVDGALTKVANVPAGDYSAVWGFGANDIWLSNGVQLVHFDGGKWQPHDTGTLFSGISQLWGDAGIVYFATRTEFGRWNGSCVEVLLRPPAGTKLADYPGAFGRFWGRSATEVFLPLRDLRYSNYTCGSAFMFYFDGSQFHQF